MPERVPPIDWPKNVERITIPNLSIRKPEMKSISKHNPYTLLLRITNKYELSLNGSVDTPIRTKIELELND